MKLGRLLLIGAIGVFCLTACAPGVTPSPLISAPTLVSSMPSPSPFPTQVALPTATFTLPATAQIPVWGMVMEQIAPDGLNQVAQAGTSWVRSYSAVSWVAVEPVEGKRNWNALTKLEEELRNITGKGMQTILSVRFTPSWAQKVAGYSCGPIKPEKLGAFASFVHDLVVRYSVPPYNVKYWEIWNEPDIDPSLVSPDSPFGCWGDQNDAYYGGGYYAEMLKAAYPQVKAADPQAQVLVGGLVLDCDPRPGAGCAAVGSSDLPPKFLEGILRNDGGLYFDGVSFHAYDYYQGQSGQYGNSNWHSAWNTNGPVSGVKVAYLRNLLAQYGHPDKFLVNTEIALLCGRSGEEPPCQADDFANTKSYYIAQSYTTALAEGLRANIWFSLFGWRASGLLNPGNQAPLPAFEAYRFSAQELGSARFLRQLQEYPGVSGYEFEREGQRIWVLWSLDGTDHDVSLDASPRAVFDVFGISLPTSERLHVTLKPIYVEWQ